MMLARRYAQDYEFKKTVRNVVVAGSLISFVVGVYTYTIHQLSTSDDFADAGEEFSGDVMATAPKDITPASDMRRLEALQRYKEEMIQKIKEQEK